MKAQKTQITILALSAFILASCGKGHNPNYYGNMLQGGRCRTGALGGAINYSETGIGTTSRNGAPAQLELTLWVDQSGRVGASGLLQISDSGTFFAEGYGNTYDYYAPPVRGPMSVCVSTQGAVGSWDDNYNETSSNLMLIGGNIELQFAPGAYVSSNGLFVPNASIRLRNYPSGNGDITFTPGGGGF
jgi:hypothetical protein